MQPARHQKRSSRSTATRRRRGGGDGSVFEEVDTGLKGEGSVPFSVVVGSRAAVLVVNDRIVAAVRTPENAKVLVEPLRPGLELNKLHVGPAPDGSGCAGT